MFSNSFCNILLGFYPTIYLLHKTAVYWMFSFRIEYSFTGTNFAFPSHYYKIFRGVAVIILTCLVTGILYTLLPHFIAKPTADGKYMACAATNLGIFRNPGVECVFTRCIRIRCTDVLV
eukprot:1143426_1